MNIIVSSCCYRAVLVCGEVTRHYECVSCGKPCDGIMMDEKDHEPKLSLQEKYQKAIDYLKALSGFEDCEYPFHAYDDNTAGNVPWLPTHILKELGETE